MTALQKGFPHREGATLAPDASAGESAKKITLYRTKSFWTLINADFADKKREKSAFFCVHLRPAWVLYGREKINNARRKGKSFGERLKILNLIFKNLGVLRGKKRPVE